MLKIFISLSLLLSIQAFSQTVEKVKGTKALLDLGSLSTSTDSELVTVTSDGRKVGLLKVTQIKGTKAIAEIVKGTVAAGMTLAPRPNAKKRFADEPKLSGSTERTSVSKNGYGALLGFGMDTMTVSSTVTTTYTGSTMKIKGFYDYNLSRAFTMRFSGGMDGFTVTGSGGNLTIQYLSLDGAMLWQMNHGSGSLYYLDGGYSFQNPMSSSNNLGLTSQTNHVIFFGGSMSIPLGKKMYMPIYAHYNYNFPSTSVNLYSMEFGVALGWH